VRGTGLGWRVVGKNELTEAGVSEHESKLSELLDLLDVPPNERELVRAKLNGLTDDELNQRLEAFRKREGNRWPSCND
jgi:hypothetical protein